MQGIKSSRNLGSNLGSKHQENWPAAMDLIIGVDGGVTN